MNSTRMFRWLRIAALCCLPLVLHQTAGAQGIYTLDWSAIEGGGGESAGGDFTVSGGFGQPESGGTMAGGEFSVTGGFLSIIAVDGPPLRIAHNPDGTITVAWPTSFTPLPLQQSSDLTPESWEDSEYPVTDDSITRSITFTPVAARYFFRLVK
jgi:hypothetical protein